ncbi:Spermidine/putrescine transport system permease protein PotB [Tritonibacter multivorans]|uniref:Spermidine/putrescine transport system permease protein PotB n=1 Tax=Tritonibacter multivorans TaxID=928856 RepID=A0A0P1GDT1_9RHOB|nr:ABC transporter permease [Tritonibacter multivorans]MDA7420177.1 ABC transporter permease [Tritonibacter multivorans]CUH79837.1 Spermidine/putrescine transport system permease protein PotB [Tritonibacter multivorans]SFC01391.1 putative spermidine/putrescine transport system permease protein [Tritonibacter multivorans]
MTDATFSPDEDVAKAPAKGLTTADGRPLKQALARAQSHARWRAFFLVAPLLAFILLTFVVPIGQMLHRSVYNDGFTLHEDIGSGTQTPLMTNLKTWFKDNPAGTDPDEAAFAALAADLLVLREVKAAGQAGTRINYELSGSRSMFTKAARRAKKLEPPYKEAILDLDEDWGDPMLWRVMRDATSAYTANFYLAAMDRTKDVDGNVVSVNENRQVYVKLFTRTLMLSLLITFLCFLLAYPIAHLLATLPLAKSNLLMILVLLPFWTSLLVRTTSWMVLLQSQGVVNDALVSMGLLGDENRLQMMYNQLGTIIAMTHILLPFMVLPLYSVMRPINPSYVRAARSLGATSWTAFRRIYFPQTVPGIGAGALLVFILAVGYYITPALVGGADGQLISNLIAFHMQKSLNWSLAAALAALLLGGILLLYWLYDRLVGIDNLKLG